MEFAELDVFVENGVLWVNVVTYRLEYDLDDKEIELSPCIPFELNDPDSLEAVVRWFSEFLK